MSSKRKMTAWLPATPCHSELREELKKHAAKTGRSMVDLQREAVSLFLLKVNTERIDNTTVRLEEQAS